MSAGDHPPARSRSAARRDQRRALAQPVRAAAAAEADARRQRGPLPGGAGAARSRAGAEHAVEGAARRAAHQPREHGHHLAGQRLRRQARGRSGRVRLAERAGRRRRGHHARAPRRQRRREGSQGARRPATPRGSRSTRFPARRSRAASPASSPVLDPATRTAPIEIEIPNSDFRLKPGMYARVGITTETKKEALVVPVERRRRSRRAPRRVPAAERRRPSSGRCRSAPSRRRRRRRSSAGSTKAIRSITTGARALRDGDRMRSPAAGRRDDGRRRTRTRPAERRRRRATARQATGHVERPPARPAAAQVGTAGSEFGPRRLGPARRRRRAGRRSGGEGSAATATAADDGPAATARRRPSGRRGQLSSSQWRPRRTRRAIVHVSHRQSVDMSIPRLAIQRPGHDVHDQRGHHAARR